MVKKGRPRKMKSKRVLAKVRYKVQKKVKEHRRKLKKEEKKRSHKEPKKDIGVPNLAPFKENILKEAQDRKAKAEEEKKRQKDRRFKEVMKQRKLGDLRKNAEMRGKEFEKKQAGRGPKDDSTTHSPRDTETSRKTYYKEFKKVLEASDVVIQVLDARDPLGSRCPQLEQAVLSAGVNKKMVLLLNKIDLVPSENVEKWLKHLRNEFPTVAFKASTQLQRQNLAQSKVPITLSTKDLLQSSRCLGAETLMKLLNNYCRNADIKMAITVGIVGFPNVGKSSVINSLKRAKACSVGSQPGVTKSKQEVQLAKNIKLLDSPGVVMATTNSEVTMVLRNCIKIEALDDPISPVEAILRRCNKQQIMLHYTIPDFNDVNEFLSLLAKRQGKLKKGGVPDVGKAARGTLMDWNSGRISFYTHPPEQHSLPAHIDAKIISEMGRAFDIGSLEQDDKQTLGVLPPVRPSNTILVESAGLTMGVTDEEMGSSTDMEAEKDDSDIDDEGDDDDDDEKAEFQEGEDWEDMEDVEDKQTEDAQLGNVSVSLKSKTSNQTPSKSAVSKVTRSTRSTVTPSKPQKTATLGNDQQNKSKKKEFKQILKKRKRSDKLATNLSNELTQAMDFLGSASDKGDELYDFNEDFV
ncbi:guanine nucleotide-binding protein-like 3 homolog [Patiria miniata]|uniref:CP-type G domain-containing protein n=1 Tax=Patiria miniata TaxID=46514 RepID=A0A914AE89_PATMI|nr:guanine nucleotide-binding protein-like 3 homolog [Patiria miniata]